MSLSYQYVIILGGVLSIIPRQVTREKIIYTWTYFIYNYIQLYIILYNYL